MVATAPTQVDNCNVVVIGDTMVDRYIVGSAHRLSPEAPIPIVAVDKVLTFPGGAGNVQSNLKSLGVNSTLYNPEGSIPPVKNRLIAGTHCIARWDEHDVCEPIDTEYLANVILPTADIVVVSDYGKGSITDEVIKVLGGFRGYLYVDTKGFPSVWPSRATMFPNEHEFSKYSGAYSKLTNPVIVKRGARGATVLHTSLSYPSLARSVVSVCGAGDTVIAAYVYGYHFTTHNPVLFAMAAAAIAVEHPYTYAPKLEEVEERLYEYKQSN